MNTKKPCIGCGEVYRHRKADELCENCQILIAEARLERLKKLQQPETQAYRIVFAAHALPYIPHSRVPFERDVEKDIKNTFYSLIMQLSVESPDDHCDNLLIGKLSGDYHPSRLRHSYRMKVSIREDLNNLYHLIKDLSKLAYEEGKQDGQSLLVQLATGDLSVNEFNERTIGKE